MNHTKRNPLFRSAICVALAGIYTGAQAAPTLFTATATVQNAVTISQTTALNFGNVFATKTNTGQSGVNNTASNKLTLSPTGTVTPVSNTFSWSPASNAPGPLLSLGGHAAGVFSATVPSGALVQVEITNADGNLIDNAASAANAECAYDNTGAALSANKIILTSTPTAAFFCLDAFTSNVPNLIGTGPSQTATGHTTTSTTLTFNLGATLVMQAVATGSSRQYSAGAHTGQFGLEVVFK